MQAIVYDLNHERKISLGRKIAEGGEGEIREIIGDKRICAKLYYRGKGSREKIVAMLKNRPHDPMNPQHVSLAWPEALLLNERRDFLGFVMPYVSAVPAHKIYSTESRIKMFGGSFNWFYLYTSALNFASVVACVHSKGYVIGDLNEKNILVSPNAFVTLIDCDSFTVKDGNKVYRNNVGVSEYAAPEVLTRGYEYRTERSDRFAVAVFIFKFLMLGFHPFSCKWNDGGEPPSLESRIKAGITPFFTSNSKVEPPPNAPPISILPLEIRKLFERAFVLGCNFPSLRPTAQEWFRTLKFYAGLIRNGCRNKNHFYFSNLSSCPWCEYAKNKTDPFPTFLNCPTCNYRNSWNSIYCERCGSDLVQEYHRCPNCSSPIPANSIYCRVCGFKVKA